MAKPENRDCLRSRDKHWLTKELDPQCFLVIILRGSMSRLPLGEREAVRNTEDLRPQARHVSRRVSTKHLGFAPSGKVERPETRPDENDSLEVRLEDLIQRHQASKTKVCPRLTAPEMYTHRSTPQRWLLCNTPLPSSSGPQPRPARTMHRSGSTGIAFAQNGTRQGQGLGAQRKRRLVSVQPPLKRRTDSGSSKPVLLP